MKQFLRLVAILVIPISLYAQSISVTNTVVNGAPCCPADDPAANGCAIANDFNVPMDPTGPVVRDFESYLIDTMLPGLNGHDYGYWEARNAKESTGFPIYSRVSARTQSWAFVDGNMTSTVTIDWGNTVADFCATDAGYFNFGCLDINFTISMVVTGLPPGTDAVIHYWYDVFGSGITDHEGPGMEDPVDVDNDMFINNVNQFPNNTFDFTNPLNASGWNELKNVTGSFKVPAGQVFTFSAASQIDVTLNPDPIIGSGLPVDYAHGNFIGNIVFTVLPHIYPAPVNNTIDMMPLFSLDIGSDSELSDPKMEGNELFDPGDMYPWSTVAIPPPGPIIPWKDDSTIFLTDPPPFPYPPFNPAPPPGSGPPAAVQPVFFDLDGSDCVQMDLTNIAFGPGMPSIPFTNDSCIYEARYFFVSLDDDTGPHYVSGLPSMPVNSTSPFQGAIFSESGRMDEVLEYNFNILPPVGLGFQDSILSEPQVHANLAPDPVGTDINDDDLDALDMVPVSGGSSPCSNWYFSADHEAHFEFPPDTLLDPAIIYQVTPTGPVPIINSLHHGLPAGTDIDAFEFAWVWDTSENRLGLALIFSVDDDDILTPDDESGGLLPTELYYSFLNGTSDFFAPYRFDDDIDAIAIYSHSLNGTIASPNPVWGTKTWTGKFGNQWINSLNWFPHGVPFDSENVTVPGILPTPVVRDPAGVYQFECKTLDVLPSGQINVRPGNILIIKG